MDIPNNDTIYIRADRSSINKKILMIIFFVVGIIGGTFIFNSLNSYEQTRLMIYSDYITDRIRFSDINHFALFRYIFLYRAREIAILIIVGLTQYRFVLHTGYVCYLGIKNSMLLCLLTIMQGKMAIICFIALMIPHIVVYVYLVLYILNTFDFNVSLKSYGKTRRMMVIIFNFVIMCLLEAFVNPLLISIIK